MERSFEAQRAHLFSSCIAAGFPSPADDYVERTLDLNARLVPNPASTFFVRVFGESMTGAGIFTGDILIVDRSVSAESGDIIVAVLGGDFLVKRFWRRAGQVELRSESPCFPPIKVGEESDFEVWGVVRHAIHSF